MSNSFHNMSLDRIYSVSDLGVLLDPKLKFDSLYCKYSSESSWVYKTLV